MDSLRSAGGYGAQSGQEPLSGETGRGTANEPYDAGNLAGQSGAPASEATSTNPTGTTQYDTGTYNQTNPTGYGAGNDSQTGTTAYTAGNETTSDSQHRPGDDSTKTNTTESLAAGVTGGDSEGLVNPGATDSPADHRPLDTTSVGNTSNAADKGTDETRGPDEQVTSGDSSDHPRPTNDNNHNAQDTFFAKAGLSKDKPAEPPKVASEVADKDPFSSSGSAAASSNETNEASSQLPPTSSDTTSGGGLEQVGSTAPDKNYKTADTEPHPQSSEVLSSATPGAALDSQPQSQTTGSGFGNTTTTSGGGYDDSSTSGGGYDVSSTTRGSGLNSTTDTGNSGYDSTPATTTAAAADTDYPSPKTQPTESQGGLSGISHNTGSAPSAPHTGVPDAGESPSLEASQGEAKKKMGDRIKEKLHIGKKSAE